MTSILLETQKEEKGMKKKKKRTSCAWQEEDVNDVIYRDRPNAWT